MPTIDGVPVDVFVSRDAEYAAEAPDDPCEDGTNFSDNLIDKPLTITVEGWCSDTPPYPIVEDDGGVPSAEALAGLIAAWLGREPVTIDTGSPGKSGGEVYANMALTLLSVPRDADTGQALRFKASFKQITIVQNTRTTVRVATPSAQKKQSLGNKQTTTLSQRDLDTLNATRNVANSLYYAPPGSGVAKGIAAFNGRKPLKGEVGTIDNDQFDAENPGK